MADDSGNTALHWAILYGDKASAELLIDKIPAEALSHANKDGNTALLWAIERGDKESAELLIDKIPAEALSHANQDSITAFHWAILQGDKESAKLLIAKMSAETLSQVNNFGNTALHLAILQGDKESAKLLIDKLSQADNPRFYIESVKTAFQKAPNWLDMALKVNKPSYIFKACMAILDDINRGELSFQGDAQKQLILDKLSQTRVAGLKDFAQGLGRCLDTAFRLELQRAA